MKGATEYCAGKMTFDEFARSNQQDWQRMARYLLRRFPIESAAEDDVVQELLIGSWQASRKFDPARGVSAERYLVFNMMSKAKKRLKRAVRPFEELLVEAPSSERDELPPSQVEDIERGRRLRQLIDECRNLTEAVVLIAYYQQEDCTLAASSLYTDPKLRRLCRFGSPQDATRKVRRVLQRIHPHEQEEEAEHG